MCAEGSLGLRHPGLFCFLFLAEKTRFTKGSSAMTCGPVCREYVTKYALQECHQKAIIFYRIVTLFLRTGKPALSYVKQEKEGD
jgi:hypothetical protein